jgi:biopolymer transport protein ExbD
MAMSIGPSSGDEEQAISTINTTPLVDVMLVLLIIFLITIPVITKTVKVDLPKAVNIPTVTKPEDVTVAVDKDGNIFWKDQRVKDRNELLKLVETEAVKKPQPEFRIKADQKTRYEYIGRVMYAIMRGGIVKVGFLTEPDRAMQPVR